MINEIVVSKHFKCILLTSKSDGFLSTLQNKNLLHYRLFYKWYDLNILTFFSLIITQIQIFLFVLFRTNKNDIIYINTILPFSVYLASIISKRQIVNHIHEDMNLNKLLYKFIKKIYLKYNQHSIFVSKYIKSVTPNPNNSIVVYNNIKDHTLKSKIEIDKRDYILMISSLKLFKGIDTFISLAKESPENNFVLVLSSELEQIDSFLKKNQLYISKNLKIFPIQKKIDYFYSKAYITLVLTKPNEWIETFGLTILESFSHGTPVIAPNYGGPIELIAHGQDGYLIDDVSNKTLIRQTINDFLIDKKNMILFSDNSRKKYLKFQKENSYNQITTYLKNI